MSQAAKPFEDAEKSKRSPETEQARKKQKLEPVTFSDPNSLVTFIIGKEGNTADFTIHKEVACSNSKVLNAAFNSGFIEGLTQTYRLEDTTEEAFRLLMQWLYSQKLVLPVLESFSSGTPSSDRVGDETTALTKLWVLADSLEMPRLQNVTLQAINDLSVKSNAIVTKIYSWIYENTASGSLLRRHTIANLATFNIYQFTVDTYQYPHELLVEFGLYMLKREKGLEKKELAISDYLVKED